MNVTYNKCMNFKHAWSLFFSSLNFVPNLVIHLLTGYFDSVHMRFTLNEWQRLEKGILTGCIISTNPFIFVVH